MGSNAPEQCAIQIVFNFAIIFSSCQKLSAFGFKSLEFFIVPNILPILRHGPRRLAFASCGHALSVNRSRGKKSVCKCVSLYL